jgi:hypothetical protein
MSFNCETKKGEFPHLFVKENNLNYIGNKPDIKYYALTDISLEEYNKIKSSNWNLKDECLNYLEKDVVGLLDVLNQVSLYYYKEFGVNITKFMTLPSLAMAVFGFNFYDENYKLKMIKGPLEKFIRNAYFGGNVGAFAYNKETKGTVVNHRAYHYDMNSQYPYAMLNKMPTGDPVFSNNTDLSYYFGFVYALITPPSENELQNLYIQCRTNEGKIICPREPFYRWIATFELESALKDNYKAKIFYGINFPNSKAKELDTTKLFENYVSHFYDKKKNAKDIIERNIAKLMLNSLYGKFGQKDIDSKIRIVTRVEANKLLLSHHVSYFAEINDQKVLIKYSSKLNERLRRIYSNEDKLSQIETNFKKERGVVSAVQISCAIAAYARMSINPFKNIKSNRLYYSDTDSLILENELSSKIVGNELGQWKLEAVIEKGVFIRPKLYSYVTNEGILKKVASGIDSKKLNYADYEALAKGKSVKTNKIKMTVNWETLKVTTCNQDIILKMIPADSG